MYMFGLTSREVERLWMTGYHSAAYCANNLRLRRVVDSLNIGYGGESFSDLATYLLSANGISDPYMCLADYESYRAVHDRAIADYADRDHWSKMSLTNIASSGFFAADRSIREYADRIWNMKPLDTTELRNK